MLKRFLPKALFARMLLIIILPTILAQGSASYIFYHRHWDNVAFHMVNSLASEIKTIVQIRSKIKNLEAIKVLEESMPIAVTFYPGQTLEKCSKIPNILEELDQVLKKKITQNYCLELNENESLIIIKIAFHSGYLHITAPLKRVYNSTTEIFILWLVGLNLLFVFLSIIFSRGQIRPIIRLARAAEQFGKGQEVTNLKIEGALEIRKASLAFLKMKERIEKQISHRMEMLSGISHDLRTPITRIKLQLAMMNDERISGITQDIKEMEQMINAYLDFARGQSLETSETVNLGSYLNSIVKQYNNPNIKIISKNRIKVFLKKNNFKRAISNVIDNAIKFGSEVYISFYREEEQVFIIIEDNGPGIDDSYYDTVFKPFFRIEDSRNKETGGIGLGLAITRDIINEHGGDIELARSKNLGGLKFVIKLP